MSPADAGGARRWSGWLFDNPDTGTELSENHPVRSGECDDAENIRPATREALRDELLAAWRGWAEEHQSHNESCSILDNTISIRDATIATLTARIAEVEAATAKARDDALEEAARIVENERSAWDTIPFAGSICDALLQVATAIRAARTKEADHGR